jgi:hypothetical protein
MGRSISATANFVFKLHVAALESAGSAVRLYPVMDGVYASSASQGDFLAFLCSVFSKVAEAFNAEGDNGHRFVIRGGIAFGPVYHGASLGVGASKVLTKHTAYRDMILLGLPMVQAHIAEPAAPPFGLFVHESARTFAPPGASPLRSVWWHWKTHKTAKTWSTLGTTLHTYLDWCAERAESLQYPADRIARHKEMFTQFQASAI